MKAFTYSITIVNVTLFALFWWMQWFCHFRLPGQLNAQMRSDVMLQKYQNVCASLTASMAGMCLLAIVLVNVALIYAYLALKKSVSPAPGGDTPLMGGGQMAPGETDSDKS